jgi:hypothetical protein
MLDVIERKWRSFASDLYTARIVKFSAMLATVFAASVVEPGSVAFQVAAITPRRRRRRRRRRCRRRRRRRRHRPAAPPPRPHRRRECRRT